MANSKAGRPRKPDALKRLHGTDRKDRKVKNTAEPKGTPRRPVGLSSQAIKVWENLEPRLTELGLLADTDESTFAVFCQAYGDWLEMTCYLNKLGITNWYTESASGYRQVIPEVAVRDKAYQVMRLLGSRFGLDPSSRSGISTTVNQAPVSSAEEFLFSPKVMTG